MRLRLGTKVKKHTVIVCARRSMLVGVCRGQRRSLMVGWSGSIHVVQTGKRGLHKLVMCCRIEGFAETQAVLAHLDGPAVVGQMKRSIAGDSAVGHTVDAPRVQNHAVVDGLAGATDSQQARLDTARITRSRLGK